MITKNIRAALVAAAEIAFIAAMMLAAAWC